MVEVRTGWGTLGTRLSRVISGARLRQESRVESRRAR